MTSIVLSMRVCLVPEYQYVDVTKPKHDGSGKRTDHKFTFDIDKEVISKMTSDGIIQNIPLYDSHDTIGLKRK